MSTTIAKPESRAAPVWDPLQLVREEMVSLWSQLVGEPFV